MRLSQIIMQDEVRAANADVEITGITSDSRAVKPGYLFMAVKGVKSDGAQFISDARARGAAAVLSEKEAAVDMRLLVPRIAARFYPRQPEHMVAVTGTDGKTSTVHFCRELWQRLGVSSASVGTLGIIAQGKVVEETGNTSPDPVVLHRALSTLAEEGVRAAAVEASSHGLDQHRLDGLRLQAAAWTNLSRDHMDYHPTEEAYRDAKARLFRELLPTGAAALLNADDPHFNHVHECCRTRGHRVTTFGRAGKELKLLDYKAHSAGASVVLECFGRKVTMDTPLVGSFQIYNILCAAGLVTACGSAPEAVIEQLSTLPGVPGRMEPVMYEGRGCAVYVDYAHTPNALAQVLASLRPHTKGRLLVVFGCGGDRDRGKRPQMGEVATRMADAVFVTDDNPRSEAPAAIRREILAACADATEIGDRAAAIHAAVADMRAGDILLIAGKGHEKTQTVGTTETYFDDVQVARAAIATTKETV
ncbi:MAG: UDP-N-acetylmuramoyl-L-alanyl-D-glutamate--2,6-diaminopimelate ligase [Alphaproteobacteria bacterium]|nr:UDP-N-acetylmuramoyl-L-alanyl-D-glutamate--2,6-diaminopimelate ligase [Alphaproteobacteria bacterium]